MLFECIRNKKKKFGSYHIENSYNSWLWNHFKVDTYCCIHFSNFYYCICGISNCMNFRCTNCNKKWSTRRLLFSPSRTAVKVKKIIDLQQSFFGTFFTKFLINYLWQWNCPKIVVKIVSRSSKPRSEMSKHLRSFQGLTKRRKQISRRNLGKFIQNVKFDPGKPETIL